jgi:type II secretion system protein H
MMRGFTLIEVVVVLALMALLSGVVVAAARGTAPTPAGALLRELAAARDSAVRGGRAITWRDSAASIRFLPDGSSSGASLLRDGMRISVDVLTGTAHAQR